MIIALLLACTAPCGPDESETIDGCVPQATSAAWDETTLPGYRLRECVIEAGDGRLDFSTGCSNGACWDDTYAEFVVALGQPDGLDSSGSTIKVDWDFVGMYAYFDDADGDNRPNDADVPGWFVVNDRVAGSSTEGLRVDLSLACFVQVLGLPDDVDTENGVVQTLHFDALSLRVSDYTSSQTFLDLDGYVDVISFSGRP